MDILKRRIRPAMLINGDCLYEMAKIPRRSVDLVIVDLPYGQTACEWDIPIDLTVMWKHLKKILTRLGTVIFITTTKYGYNLIQSNVPWFRYDIVWEKKNNVGFLLSNKMPMRIHEMIYVFHNSIKPKGQNWTYNPQKIEGSGYLNKRDCKDNEIYSTELTATNTIINDRHPNSVIVFGRDKDGIHPTQKPVDLCEYLIRTYSNEGQVVLDFCMGSGSTIVACINTKRQYIGIEKDKIIYDNAKCRIKDMLNKIDLNIL